jgi:hypothetical protein
MGKGDKIRDSQTHGDDKAPIVNVLQNMDGYQYPPPQTQGEGSSLRRSHNVNNRRREVGANVRARAAKRVAGTDTQLETTNPASKDKEIMSDDQGDFNLDNYSGEGASVGHYGNPRPEAFGGGDWPSQEAFGAGLVADRFDSHQALAASHGENVSADAQYVSPEEWADRFDKPRETYLQDIKEIRGNYRKSMDKVSSDYRKVMFDSFGYNKPAGMKRFEQYKKTIDNAATLRDYAIRERNDACGYETEENMPKRQEPKDPVYKHNKLEMVFVLE